MSLVMTSQVANGALVMATVVYNDKKALRANARIVLNAYACIENLV